MRTATEWQRYLVDKNGLLRFTRRDDVDYAIIQAGIERPWISGEDRCSP